MGEQSLEKRFEELNHGFMKTCVESLKTMGADSCLAPVAADYILHCLKLLSEVAPDDPKEIHPSSFLTLGARLRNLIDEYFTIFGDMDIRNTPSTATQSLKGSSSTEFSALPLSALTNEHTSATSEPREPLPIFSQPKPSHMFSIEPPPPSPEKKQGSIESKSHFKSEKRGEPEPSSNLFNFNSKKMRKTSPETSTFSASSNGFVFGLNNNGPAFQPAPLIFNGFGTGISATSTPTSGSPSEDDEDEKAEKEAQAHEFKPVLEDEALYTARCKIFQMNKSKNMYEPRGVGNLFVQKLETKHRLLIRADNNLGNILLNMIISPDIPFSISSNKKQIVTVDPIGPTPITILVKDAEQLLKILKACQETND